MSSSTLDVIRRGLRIGAFSGLAITIFAITTDSKWLLEDKYLIKPKEKDLEEMSLNELKAKYLDSLQKRASSTSNDK